MEKIIYNYYQNSRVLIVVPIFIIIIAIGIYGGIRLYKALLHSYLIEKIIMLGIPLIVFSVEIIGIGKIAVRQSVIFHRCISDECQSIVLDKDDISLEVSSYRDTQLYRIIFKGNNGNLIKPINAFSKQEIENFSLYNAFTVEYIEYGDDIYIYRVKLNNTGGCQGNNTGNSSEKKTQGDGSVS
jgi:hypothetical protein